MLIMIKDTKLAVLIDGDNIPSKYIKEMMEEITKYGTPTIKRIYGDWTKPHLTKWKNILLENANLYFKKLLININPPPQM